MDLKNGYRIGYFTNTYLPFVGGVAGSVELYRKYLTAAGHDVVVYAPEYDEETPEYEYVRRLPAIKQFNQTDFSLPLPVSFKPILDFNREAFDLIHVHHPFLLGEMGMRMARSHKLPLVFTYHTQYEQFTHYVPMDHDTAARTIIKHSKEFCNLCDLVIAPTSDVRDMLVERGIESRIAVLPTGIEMTKYRAGDRAAGRKALGVPEDAPLLVHVGRLAEEKNLSYLLEACTHALEKIQDAHLVIVGDGAAKKALEQAASAMKDRIHFPGRMQGAGLVNAYTAADLFVFASKSETQGMVLAEAMAAGNPVIALDATGVREVLVDGESGRMLAEDTPAEAFGEVVADVLGDVEQRTQWSENALKTAAGFDMPILADKVLEEYRALKLLPNHCLKEGNMSFGLIRNFFDTVWHDLSDALARI